MADSSGQLKVQPRAVDPDPYSIAAVWIAAAALVLQFVQVAQGAAAAKRDKAKDYSPDQLDLRPLEGLIDEFRSLENRLNDLNRIVERGSLDAEIEFYDARFGVSIRSMNLQEQWHDKYSETLANAYTNLASFSRWINLIIRVRPELAFSIGVHLESLERSASQLNEAMYTARPNRDVVSQCRAVLESMKFALESVRDREN